MSRKAPVARKTARPIALRPQLHFNNLAATDHTNFAAVSDGLAATAPPCTCAASDAAGNRRAPSITLPTRLTTGTSEIFASDASQQHVDDIHNLYRSNSLLNRRVEDLAHEIRIIRAEAQVMRGAVSPDAHSRESYAFRRTRQFARKSAASTLLSPSKEISKNLYQLCVATSVRQSILKTKGVGCSLFEFRAFARACVRNQGIKCDLFPSSYYVFHLRASDASLLQKTFPTYYDFCSALGIDIAKREAGLYRVKKGRKSAVHTVQILGFQQVRPAQSLCQRSQRRVFPGAVSRTRVPIGPGCAFFKNRRHGPTIALPGMTASCAPSNVRPCPRREAQTYHKPLRCLKSAEFTTTSRFFLLIWKRDTQDEAEGNSTLEESNLGFLTCTIPTIVLRGKLLTSAAHSVLLVD